MSQTITVPNFSATQNYTYDSMLRLYTASELQGSSTNWSEQFGYDTYSNRWLDLAHSNLSSVSPLTPTGSNWFTSKNQIEDPADGTRFNYDTAGNQTAVGLSTLTATYDAENRLTSYTATTSARELYDYDGEGNRVRHRHQVWDPGSSTWGTTKTILYVYDAFGKLAAEYGTAPASEPCSTCYLTTDMLGSTRMVTDQTGTVVARFDYYPFGEKIMASGTTGRGGVLCGSLSCYPYDVSTPPSVNHLFTGMERDFDTVLDYDFVRYYSGAEGRFLQADTPLLDQYPNDPQSWNLYGYVRNNPLIYTDPDGRKCVDGLDSKTDAPCELPFVSTDWLCSLGYVMYCGSSGRTGPNQPPITTKTGPPPEIITTWKGPQPKCHIEDPVLGVLELKLKVGAGVKLGPLKVDIGSVYKNVTTGETGTESGVNLFIVSAQTSQPTPETGTFGGGNPTRYYSINVAGFEYDFASHSVSWHPSAVIKDWKALQFIAGAELVGNGQTFVDQGLANNACRAQGGN